MVIGAGLLSLLEFRLITLRDAEDLIEEILVISARLLSLLKFRLITLGNAEDLVKKVLVIGTRLLALLELITLSNAEDLVKQVLVVGPSAAACALLKSILRHSVRFKPYNRNPVVGQPINVPWTQRLPEEEPRWRGLAQ